MTTAGEGPAPAGFAQLALGDLLRQVGDPGHRSGGGAVAALTLAGAAAVTELVIRLALDRPRYADRRTEIEQLLVATRAIGARALTTADRDAAAFAALMDAQHRLKEADEASRSAVEQGVRSAWIQAAAVPLELAADGVALLRLLQQALPLGTRFTVSDLGAAAALTRSAIEAATLTADANLAYLDAADRGDLQTRSQGTRDDGRALAAAIERDARERLSRRSQKKTGRDAGA